MDRETARDKVKLFSDYQKEYYWKIYKWSPINSLDNRSLKPSDFNMLLDKTYDRISFLRLDIE